MIANMFASARYARVLRLLDLERKLILNGPLAGLKPLVEQREAAVAEILANETDLPEAFLAALKARAERNGRLLLASLAVYVVGCGLAMVAPSFGWLLAARIIQGIGAAGGRVSRPYWPVFHSSWRACHHESFFEASPSTFQRNRSPSRVP